MKDQLSKVLFSTRLTAVLFILYPTAMAFGTFIESWYSTDTAKIWIYNAWWFELIMVLMALNFFGNIFKYRLLRKEKWAVTSFQNGDKVSKHYFMNAQRVASEIEIIEEQTPLSANGSPSDSSLVSSFTNNASVIDFNSALEELGVSQRLTAPQKLPKVQEFYPEYANQSNTEASVYYKVMYWYHPDYIGNVDLVTDRNGEAFELFLYNAWGENMYDWESGAASFSSPYRFNGKEEDPETGFRYYGARYHHPKLSVWLSHTARRYAKTRHFAPRPALPSDLRYHENSHPKARENTWMPQAGLALHSAPWPRCPNHP